MIKKATLQNSPSGRFSSPYKIHYKNRSLSILIKMTLGLHTQWKIPPVATRLYNIIILLNCVHIKLTISTKRILPILYFPILYSQYYIENETIYFCHFTCRSIWP
mgnify:CR=1 FL=1